MFDHADLVLCLSLGSCRNRSGNPALKRTLGRRVPQVTTGGQRRFSCAVVAVPGATVSYQWYANGKKVKKATKPNLKVAPGLKRKKLSVQVTVSAPGYAPVTQVVQVGKVG